jgi:SNF2 family DNA or RNA helicase
MSHGLDLTAATTIIWAAPTYSNEVYEQACARIKGPRQKHKTSIVHIEGSKIEQAVYKRLSDKQHMQDLLLSIIQEQGDVV